MTSTVQHVDKLYEVVAEQFNNSELKSGNLSFDFDEGVISLGKFSPLIEEEFKTEILSYIEQYKETGKVPNQ